jgi:hypothetical protein
MKVIGYGHSAKRKQRNLRPHPLKDLASVTT